METDVFVPNDGSGGTKDDRTSSCGDGGEKDGPNRWWEMTNRPRRHMGEEASSCDSKASFFSTAKYTVIAMNRVRFANTQFLNEMSTYIGDFQSGEGSALQVRGEGFHVNSNWTRVQLNMS